MQLYLCPNINCFRYLRKALATLYFVFFFTEFQVSTPDNTLGSSAASPERGNTPLPLPQPELDPDTLRNDLRDFLQELREAQKERVKTTKQIFKNNSRIFECFVWLKSLFMADFEG